jgi:non-ribosomal peptide synthetase component F
MNISFSFFSIKASLFFYVDAAIERQMPMTGASMFWRDTLHGCNLDQSLLLPYDRYRLSDEHRTGRGTSVSFHFGQELSRHFLAYALSNKIEPQHLAVAIYYAFLFKLTNGERDFCIGMNTQGRYKDEFRSVIGMFVNVIPLRGQLDPYWFFHKLTEHVRETTASSMKYSYFPLQRILTQHSATSHPAFLDTSFEFISYMTKNGKNDIMIGDSQLSSIPFAIKIREDEIMSKFDFILNIQHDLDMNELSCKINASLDLFNLETVDKIAQRLHSMLQQVFASTSSETKKPIYKLSLALPNERLLMQSLNNTQVSFLSATCIHHEFIYQVVKNQQKLAVELDDQSLTYAELLHYVQQLSLHLLIKYRIISGEIVCQCVERSLSMVIKSPRSVFIVTSTLILSRLLVLWQSNWLVLFIVHCHLMIHNIVCMHLYNKLKVVLSLCIG